MIQTTMGRGRKEAKTPRRRTRRKMRLTMKPLMTVRTTTDKIERFKVRSRKSLKYQLQVDYMSDESSDSDEEEEEKADAKG